MNKDLEKEFKKLCHTYTFDGGFEGSNDLHSEERSWEWIDTHFVAKEDLERDVERRMEEYIKKREWDAGLVSKKTIEEEIEKKCKTHDYWIKWCDDGKPNGSPELKEKHIAGRGALQDLKSKLL